MVKCIYKKHRTQKCIISVIITRKKREINGFPQAPKGSWRNINQDVNENRLDGKTLDVSFPHILEFLKMS